jgi:transcriptional regulator with PAS, ATPase and Fis domain
MLSVNCAAIPDELMESQLFGHVKGAFTGADRDHVGYFQQANKGTLFLDEVGELNLEGQAKLLRILEGHPFLPVGATQEVKVDVRVVSATNRDLREFVANRRFREDLYYRLSVFEVYIPPLRDRGPDIDLLVEFFLNHFKKQNGRKHLKISQKAMEALRSYNWPGNVRQLRNVIDSAVVLADGAEILTKDLSLRDVSMPGPQLDRKTRIDMPSEDRNLRPVLGDFPNNDSQASTVIIRKKPNQGDEADQSNHSQTSPPAPTPVVMKSDFDTLNVEVWELRLIQEAMRRTGGNIQVAAELLGISRATLYRKLEKGNLNPNPDQASP